MNIRKTLLSGIMATSMTIGGAAAFAQDATPSTDESSGDASATPVAEITTLEGIAIHDAEGIEIATLDVWEDEEDGGVWFSIESVGEANVAEGKHGVHVHETGVCDSEGEAPFESAGGHFNPTMEDHGDINADPSHGGDLGNLEVDAEGNFEHEVLAEKLSMSTADPNTLADEDGSAIIIHSGEDDLESQPSGDAGERWACAVIFPPVESEGTPEATEPETPMATPQS